MPANPKPTPLPPVPGAHPDDDSVAGEEDPGASLEELPKPAAPQPAPPGSAPTSP
jgi:hypothetical protein